MGAKVQKNLIACFVMEGVLEEFVHYKYCFWRKLHIFIENNVFLRLKT